jgi:group I intron endonuclease
MPFVYLIENRLNSKKYVGITKHSIESRFKEHIRNSRGPNLEGRRLYQSMKKHGVENFDVSLLETCAPEHVYELEQKWIRHYNSNSYEFGYNMTAGGEGCVDRECSPETLLKLSNSLKEQRSRMTMEQKRMLTESANKSKRGMKESEHSRRLKSEAQAKRFSSMTAEELKEHGKRSRESISPEGLLRQAKGWNEAYSPVREKGFKQELTSCPHCGKSGGAFAMKRYHFDNCRSKETKN